MAGGGTGSHPAAPGTLTSGGERVLEHLVELGQVHHHGQLVRLPHRGHLSACHDGRNAQLFLSNIEGQLVILLHILLIQRVKISEEQDEEDMSRPRLTEPQTRKHRTME